MNRTLRVISVMLFFLTVACNKNKIKIETKAGELPLLTSANNIGMIEGFNADNPANTQDSINSCWNEAVSAGMRVGRLQLDWPGIETSEGVYDMVMVNERMEDMSNQGLKIHLLISAYDSEGSDMPDYLEGLSIDSDKVIASFNNLMTWIIPVFAENGDMQSLFQTSRIMHLKKTKNWWIECSIFLNQCGVIFMK